MSILGKLHDQSLTHPTVNLSLRWGKEREEMTHSLQSSSFVRNLSIYFNSHPQVSDRRWIITRECTTLNCVNKAACALKKEEQSQEDIDQKTKIDHTPHITTHCSWSSANYRLIKTTTSRNRRGSPTGWHVDRQKNRLIYTLHFRTTSSFLS